MTDLAQTLGTTEHDTLEFKRDVSNRDAIRKTICALANDLPGQGGGTLLIGVAKDGTPHGLAVDDDVMLQVANFRDEGRVLPLPVLRVTEGRYQGRPVIRVDVTASEFPPVRFDGTPKVRVGPSTRTASPAEERLLVERRQSRDLTFDQRLVAAATVDDLDGELFASTYLPAAVSREVIAENERSRIEQLASLRLATPAGLPTVAGILVLGLDPTTFLPGAYAQFVRYGGSDVTADVADHHEMRGNLLSVLAELETKLSGLISTALASADGFRQVDVPTYPFDAIRETIVNALVHRTYEANGPTRVLWFDDRIEVVNPGGPYGQVTDSNFDRINDYRNPVLAEAAKNLGYMNRFGRGVTLVRRALELNGNPAPEYDIEPQYWSVIMRARP